MRPASPIWLVLFFMLGLSCALALPFTPQPEPTVIEGDFPGGELIQILPRQGGLGRAYPVRDGKYALSIPQQDAEIINGKRYLRVAFIRSGRIVEVALFEQGRRSVLDIDESYK